MRRAPRNLCGNGQRALDIPLRTRDRLRLRFINGFQRNVIAIKIESHDAQVMALDGQPSEPFLARNSAVVLAPDLRICSMTRSLDHDGVRLIR